MKKLFIYTGLLAFFLFAAHVNATQLPLYIKQCDNCSAQQMKSKAEDVIRNSTVAVLDTVSSTIKVYDVRLQIQDDEIEVVTAKERSLPNNVADYFNDTIQYKNTFIGNLKASYPGLVIPLDSIAGVSQTITKNATSYTNATSNCENSSGNNAYNFMSNSSYRNNVFDALVGQNHNYQMHKSSYSATVDSLQVGVDAKFISGNLGIKFLKKELVTLPFNDGSWVKVTINSNKSGFDISAARDCANNNIPALKSEATGQFSIVGPGHYVDFQNYMDYVGNYSYVGSYQPGKTCSTSCVMTGGSHMVCTLNCR